MRGWKWLILIAVCAATVGHAYDPGMHVWLGSKTFQVWHDYDPAVPQSTRRFESGPNWGLVALDSRVARARM